MSNVITNTTTKPITLTNSLDTTFEISQTIRQKPLLITKAERSLTRLRELTDKFILITNKKSATCLLASCLKFIGELSKAKSYYSSYPNTINTNNPERAIANANRFLANQNICYDNIKRPNYYRDDSL